MSKHDDFSVSGKTIAVTGGSSGLGLGIVTILAQRGAKVISISRSHDEEAAGILDEQNVICGNYPILRVFADVSNPDEVEQAFDQAEAAYGCVSVVFNNAGIGYKASALKTTPEMLDHLFSVNVIGAFTVAQHAAKRMISAKQGGAIINTTSILGVRPQKGSAAYAMTKAALAQMTRSLALEWASHNIRVNALEPGWFPTGINQDLLSGPAGGFLKAQNPMRRFGEISDIEGAILFLASGSCNYMTGSTITIDGGHSL